MVEILKSVRDLTGPGSGCAGCWVSDEDAPYEHIRYAEQWESEAAMQEHIRSDLYRRVLAAIELSKQAPEIKFYFATDVKGFELIEELRSAPTFHREPSKKN